MSLKESMKKANQNNWTNLPKNAKKQIKKFDFNRNNQNNSYKTINYLDVQNNNNKMLQKKRPPHLLHDSRSSSTMNFFPNSKVKNSLAFYPLDIKMAQINRTHKHIDNYRLHNKSTMDIIRMPKTNTNKNSITHKILKMNSNKNKETKNINYVISAYNLPSKNTCFGDFMKKIINNNNKNSNVNAALSNSMTLINKNNQNISNIPGFDTINNINNKNEKYEAAQKEKERLNQILNEKIKNSHKINEKIKELESKNKKLIQKINKFQKKNDNLSSTLDKIIKLMKLLKSNGFDISEILANLSGFEEEEYEKKDDKDESTSTIKDFSFKVGEQVNNKEIYINENIKDNKDNNDDKDSDKVKMKKILNMNKKNAKLKEKEEFSFRNNKKIISHSVGDD
jgi:hypothetical protein